MSSTTILPCKYCSEIPDVKRFKDLPNFPIMYFMDYRCPCWTQSFSGTYDWKVTRDWNEANENKEEEYYNIKIKKTKENTGSYQLIIPTNPPTIVTLESLIENPQDGITVEIKKELKLQESLYTINKKCNKRGYL